MNGSRGVVGLAVGYSFFANRLSPERAWVQSPLRSEKFFFLLSLSSTIHTSLHYLFNDIGQIVIGISHINIDNVL